MTNMVHMYMDQVEKYPDHQKEASFGFKFTSNSFALVSISLFLLTLLTTTPAIPQCVLATLLATISATPVYILTDRGQQGQYYTCQGIMGKYGQQSGKGIKQNLKWCHGH